MDPSFKPLVKITSDTIFSSTAINKNSIYPFTGTQCLVADRTGKIVNYKLTKEGTVEVQVNDNNNGKEITDVAVDLDNKMFFIDRERVQLRESVNKNTSSALVNGVCPDDNSQGKILKLWEAKNLLYVRGNDPNTLLVVNQNTKAIAHEIFFNGVKKGRQVIDFAIEPTQGHVVGLTSNGDLHFKAVNETSTDCYFTFSRRENERFSSLAVDWTNNLAFTCGTQTLEKFRHQHIIYVYDISNHAELVLKSRSEIWETTEPEFKDTVVKCFFEHTETGLYLCCFTNFTTSLVAFRLDSSFNELEIASYPQKVNNGHLVDVRQRFGKFWVITTGSEDIRTIRLH